MKDLDKNVIYDLSDLNREERSELFDYLLSVDKTYKGSKNKFKSDFKDFICYDFCNNAWDWQNWGIESESSKYAIKNKLTINAKTLFEPKVNIINPNESNCDENIEKDYILEVILKNRIIAIEETISELEIELFHNKNLNDFIKTELMKEVTVYLKTKGVLESILKDYELEKLKQQCEN